MAACWKVYEPPSSHCSSFGPRAQIILYMPNLKYCFKAMSWSNIDAWWILNNISQQAVISASLWIDQMETDMSLDSVLECFINSDAGTNISMCQQLSNLFHFTFNVAVAGYYQRIKVTFFFLLWMKANATKYVWPQCGCFSVLSLVPRRLQEEEQQLRTSSLPAIPNPFPELCSPASSPVLSPGSLPPGEPSTVNYVSQTLHITMMTYSWSYLSI